MDIQKAHQVLKQFNKTIDTWMDWLNDYTLAMLHRQPGAGSWSLGQLYIHITDDTKFFVEQIRICLLSNDNSDKVKHENAAIMFSNNSFPDALLKGPSVNSLLRQPATKEELLHDLQAIKENVYAMYTAFDFATAKGKTLHPGLQFFTALEWLQFAEMHMRHHFRQKERIDAVLFSHP